MGLLDALNQVKKEKYDPKKDDFNSGFQPIPDGTYTVSLSGVNHGVWKNSQTDFIRFSFNFLIWSMSFISPFELIGNILK